MANYPSQLRERDELNLRLGIKSSLSQLRSVIASLYVIYVANNKQAQVKYSKESINTGLTSIKLEDNLAQQIDSKFSATTETVSSLVNKTPLFTAQIEALQVGLELFFHLAKINFVTTGLSERTGSSRYQKKLSFATNMILVDLYLSSHSNEDVNKLLVSWLEDKPFASKLEDGLKMLLNTFTEETQYKIRNNNFDEIVFNQEGVYNTVLNNGEVISKDANEPVGPFRVYKSYIASGMHPYLIEQKQEFKLKGSAYRADLENYAQLVSTTLDITPRKTFIEQETKEIKDKIIIQQPIQLANTTYLPYLTALRTKPFMLLAGISGTGKSRIVREMAKACWASGEEDYGNYCPRNFCMVQVKPNWHDSSELIGYVSRINGEKYIVGPFLRFIAQALKEPHRPYFLCLDEMNLAPVEQYFAEFLSIIESRKSQDGQIVTDPIVPYENTEAYGSLIDQLFESDEERKAYKTEKIEEGGKRLTIPQNLFVVGTVNMDETTFSFSRKVLDRAMTIEMNEVKLNTGLNAGDDNELGYIGSELIGQAVGGCDIYADHQPMCDKVIAYLERVNEVLDATPFKIAYRTRNEFLLYAVNRQFFAPDSELWQTLDEMTSMKILSRIEGDTERCERPLRGLEALLQDTLGDHAAESVSLRKIEEMTRKLQSGYTSYWT